MNYIHIANYFFEPSAESLAYRNHVIEIRPLEEEKEEIETLTQTLQRIILRWETKTNDLVDALYDPTSSKPSDTGKSIRARW